MAQQSWLRQSLAAKPARFDVGAAIRSALCIGGPFFVGAATGFLGEAMWMSFAAMLFTAGEKPLVPLQTTVRNFAFILPISVASFFTGYLSDLLAGAQLALLALVAFVAGVAATWGPRFATAAMQSMLIASMVTGMEERPYATYALFFFAGALLYLLGAIIHGLVSRRVTEVAAVNHLLDTLATMCDQRGTDISNGEAGAHTGSEVARFAQAFSAAIIPDLMMPQYQALLTSIDEAEIDLREISDPSVLRTAATQLRTIASKDASVTEWAIPVLAQVASSYSNYVNAHHRAVEKEGALAASLSQRWTSYSVSSGLRLSLCFSVALLVGFLLPIDHVFWVATTVAMVMTPNTSSVVSRALQRCAGAVIGVFLATGILWMDNSTLWLAAWITGLAFLLPWSGNSSGVYKQYYMVPIVLLFGDIIIPGPHDPQFYGPERLFATIMGAGIVFLFGYLIWPKVRLPEFSRAFLPVQGALSAYLLETSGGAEALASSEGPRREVYSTLAAFQQKLTATDGEPPPTSAIARAWWPVVFASARLCDGTTMQIARSERLSEATAESLDQLVQQIPQLQYPRLDDSEANNLYRAVRHLNTRVIEAGYAEKGSS